ncbi:MAG: hypothetical protein K2X38_23065 [Gemmataceae bacterium]|nr:hypothetical protein [Gemmataceae bacterium]
MFGNRTGHRPPPQGRLESFASILSSLTTIVTSLLVAASFMYVFGISPSSLFWGKSETPSKSDPPNAFAEPDEGKGLTPTDPKGKELLAATTAGTEKQAFAFARAKQRQAAGACDDALQALDECIAEINRFETLSKGLLQDGDGKKIAGDSSLLKRFRLIQERERPARAKAERYQQPLAEMAEPVKASLQNPRDASIPKAELFAEAERLRQELMGTRDAWRKDRILLESLLAEARRGNGSPSEKTLEETIRLTADAETRAFTEAMEKEANAAKAEMEAKLIKAKAEGIRAIEQANIDKHLAEKRAEAERIRTQAFLKEAKEKAEGEAARAKAEKERLRTKALDPRVKQMLAPLLAKTAFQPMRYDNGKIGNDFIGGGLERISFTRLKSVGALEASNEGLAALAEVGCYINRQPHWIFSTRPADWSAETRTFLQDVQNLVRELGPTLVAERMLEP